MHEENYLKKVEKLEKENARLIKEKQLTEKLLGISEALVNVSQRHQLFHLITERIGKLLPMDDLAIVIVNEDNTQWKDISIERHFSTSTLSGLIEKDFHFWQPMNSLVEHLLSTTEVMTIENYKKFKDFPVGFLAVMEDEGLKEFIHTPLRMSGETFGFLVFDSKETGTYSKKDFSLFQAIADQLAVTVSNVLANEALMEEKKKTEDLLAVTESIANITTGPELVKAIFDKLQKVFPFDDAGLFHLDIDLQRERDLIVDYSYEVGINLTLKENGLTGWLPMSGTTKSIIKNQHILMGTEIFDLLEHPHFKNPDIRDFKSVIAATLKKGKKNIGLLYFWSRKENAFNGQQSLFKSITDQMTVALSNIIANEDIQERDREKTLQLSVINALTEGIEWKDKLLGFAKILQSCIPFHFISFGMIHDIPGLPNLGFECIGPNEYRDIDIFTFVKLTKLSRKELQGQLAKDMATKPLVLNKEEFFTALKKNIIKKAMYDVFGHRSMMVYPFPIAKKRILYIAFYSKSENVYAKEHIELMERLHPSLVLIFEKLLAYDEIKELNKKLAEEKSYLQEELQPGNSFSNIIGKSLAIQRVFQQVREVAAIDIPVLILGETGTGKELVAKAIHENSPRREHLLVKVNCAAIPKDTVESELFGHVKGAFTGAIKDRVGKFELADKGTIFLDEIGEMPLDLQAKLLRVIQEKEVERMGSNQLKKIDFRIIAATNRRLEEETQLGNFRLDLFYRLSVFSIQLPPLRDRGDDILLIAKEVAQRFSKKLGFTFKGFTKESERVMLDYQWPGNVRELQNLTQQALITQRHEKLNLQPGNVYLDRLGMSESFGIVQENLEDITMEDIKRKKEILEKEYLEMVMHKTKWRVSGRHGAAALLDMKATTLEHRLKKLGITRK
ncbi:sigma 54-interacting transcriptional regulator [Aquimarina sp. U1-2]|uniref:sigma-54-dependent Fis family transcriptional regulator n=1 Tax=Aquimarina sp. U1-2 TaxID=2823141 RepID=UPI001AEC9384|nr:sigma 54-interacting transcriptional regulator [Aquimarina sp. U1-2]MBP2831230.1 sigma 54-interacting transcriptional regulator [Aquimarina sp. U1-2]